MLMKIINTVPFFAAAMLWGAVTQGQARDGSLKIGNENMEAVTITTNQPVKITSEALNDRLQRSGLKAKPKRGITTYNRVILSDISPDPLDIYTKVEKAGDNSSMISMAVSRGYSEFTKNRADSTVTVRIKEYLESFVKEANHYSADADINNYINELNKEEKMYQHLLDEETDLNKRKSELDSRLNEIRRDLRVKEERIIKKKADLEIARAKRNNLTIH
jgi:hypothetical protein